jgi:hypothetical protein
MHGMHGGNADVWRIWEDPGKGFSSAWGNKNAITVNFTVLLRFTINAQESLIVCGIESGLVDNSCR